MNPATALIALTIGIAGMIVLTARFRWNAFVAIFPVTVAVGLASGLQPGDVVKHIVNGFGGTLGYITIVVISGFIIGEFLDQTGAARAISRAVLRLVGKARAPLAMGVSGYILAVPVMCSDTAFLILSPIARGLAARTRLPLASLCLSLAVGAYTSFKLIPPSPGPLAVVTMFGADFGRTLALSFLISIPVFATGLLWARAWTKGLAGPRDGSPADAPESGETGSEVSSAWKASLPIAVPILLIALKAILDSALASQNPVRVWLDFAGHPVIALPAGVALLMFSYRGAGMETMSKWVSAALARAGSILAMVGAGGALGSVLQNTGIGDYLGKLMISAGIPGLLVPFLLAMTLKITQGSSLVTMFTTPAIVAPLLSTLGMTPEVAALATFAGALAVVHANDSFFWVVTRVAELDVPAGYRSLTVLTLLQALVGLGLVWLVSLVL